MNMGSSEIFTTHKEERATDQSDLLADIHAAITIAFDELWQNTRHSKFATPTELEAIYTKALTLEHNFADKVFAAATDLADSGTDSVVLLFDVDETIVKKEFSSTEPSGVDVVRPAFPVVIAGLQQVLNDRLEVGLLTSRGQTHLNQELQAPTYLDSMIETVNPNFVISSREGGQMDQFDHYIDASHAETINQLGDFLNPDLIKEDELDTAKSITAATASRTSWMGKKLPILKELVEQYPDKGFVYIDDAASASVINPDFATNLRSVQVYDDAGFWGLN
jgi:type II secretory pathway component PulC